MSWILTKVPGNSMGKKNSLFINGAGAVDHHVKEEKITHTLQT